MCPMRLHLRLRPSQVTLWLGGLLPLVLTGMGVEGPTAELDPRKWKHPNLKFLLLPLAANW